MIIFIWIVFLLVIILSVEPERKSTDYSATTTWIVKENGIDERRNDERMDRWTDGWVRWIHG